MYTIYQNEVKFNPNKLFLYGQSMGAVAILKAVSENNIYVDKIVMENPYSSLLSTVKNRFTIMGLPSFPFAHILTFWGGILNGFNAFSFRPIEYCSKIDTDILLLSGKLDKRVNVRNVERMYRKFPGKKKLHIFENAKHESLIENNRNVWIDVVGNYIKE